MFTLHRKAPLIGDRCSIGRLQICHMHAGDADVSLWHSHRLHLWRPSSQAQQAEGGAAMA